ncbi:toxin-antitoxin system protein [Raineyella sp. W15-4]|uniref:toxin-antitoxin system protein n=1 Tax=Raineyella sp. W15-4 TaxID=3081651 RepID=UPI002954E965|nr:toxin-antitoxin system protein [Raineyella sp. W15-4]WOQ16714.1 toxin-antitoxin system protein [Raineyella sp. W15-4]
MSDKGKMNDYGIHPDGRPVTDVDVERWADEAEAGFPGETFGPARRGPGRPPAARPRVRRVQVRVDADTYQQISEAVARRGETVSQYLLRLVREDLHHSA